MSLVVPGHGRTVPLPGRPGISPDTAPVGVQPQAPTMPPPVQSQEQQMLEYLFQQLKAQYPGVQESDLREAAKKLFSEIRMKQSEDFNQRFFPERIPQPQPPVVPQQAPAPHAPPPQPLYQRDMVNIGRPNPGASPMGMAQPIQPQDQGTPYQPNKPAPFGMPPGQPPVDAGEQVRPMSDAEMFKKNSDLKDAGTGMGMKRFYRDRDGQVKVAY